MKFYILVNKELKETSLAEWQEWRLAHDKECLVSRTYVQNIEVETRFIGYDAQGAGYLFRSKINHPGWEGESCGAQTWTMAEECHKYMCDIVDRKVDAEILKKSRSK